MPTEPFMDNKIVAALELIERDRPKGMERLESLAIAGHATAILYFALSLSEEQNRQAEEIEWLKSAYNLGFSDAAWNLAMIYNQLGDNEGIKTWINNAAGLGSVDAAVIIELEYDVNKFLAESRLD